MLVMNFSTGLHVDIRNVSYRDAQFNASLEPFIAFASVPKAVKRATIVVSKSAAIAVNRILAGEDSGRLDAAISDSPDRERAASCRPTEAAQRPC
jgi:hypothetical protein